MMEEITLKVGELTNREEFGRGIVRIDTRKMQDLGIKEGDIVELQGQKKTGAIAVRSYPADVGLNLIRMDGITRRNAGIGVGENIKLVKANVKEARRVVVAPAQKGIILQMAPDLLKKNLIMRPLMKKDLVAPFPVATRKRGGPFDDFFGGMNIEEIFFAPIPGETKLVVVSTNPDGMVRVTEETEVELKPEAVEIEEKVIPTMTYEDIGGLGESINKIREMVELPMRHPELFTKLGIEPPKGVLLYGPPGTGKTLIAKAVANESNVNFFPIGGPEVMSKWYGESLSGDEVLLVKNGELMEKMPIKDIVEKKKDVQVVAFDGEGRVKFSKIKDHLVHPRSSRLMQVKTRTGRRIKVTDYHSLFTLDNGRISSAKTSELKPGESYIAIPRGINFPETKNKKLNLLDLFKDDRDILVAGCSGYIKDASEKIGIDKTAGILGVRKKYVYDLYGKDVSIRIPKFLNLMEVAGIKYDVSKLRMTSKFKKGSLPVVIKLTPGLFRLLGIWTAEGDINKSHSVRITTLSKEVKSDLKSTARELGLEADIYEKCVFLHSKPLVKLFYRLGFVTGALKKRIPGMVFTGGEDLVRNFLRGYFTGDGSVYPNQRGILTVEGTTYSPELANDLMYLLLGTGIVASVYESPSGKNTRHRICFRGAENIGKFSKIGFLDAKRNNLVKEYASKISFERSDQIPMFGQLKNMLEAEKLGREWANSRTVGRSKLIEFLEKVDKKRAKYKEIWNVAENEIYWDRVEQVKEIPHSENYVYDVSINPSENFLAGFGGIFAHNSEANLRKIFEEAEKSAPAIIFIDEIDAIAPKREEVTGEVERRVVSQILTLMDGLKSRGKVIVIAATNRPNALDPALRRPGRFDREIEIGVPDQKGRKEILQIHTRNMPIDRPSVSLDKLAEVTYGFVGADLEALAKEAAMAALRRNLPTMSWRTMEELPAKAIEKLKVMKQDFDSALKLVEPSAMREVLVEIPKVKWDDVGGLEEVKESLREIVEWPLKHPESFERIGIVPPKGILLYGPPGSGKTLLARAVATEAGANFISIKGPEITSKWVGESEKNIRNIFKRARQVAPAIIFFDEIDALAPLRGLETGARVSENIVSQILTEMSGLEDMHDVVVIAATNRPDILDPALLRPGRFDRQVLVPAPDEEARLEIMKIHARKMPFVEKEKFSKKKDEMTEKEEKEYMKENEKAMLKVISPLAKETEGYSGADLEALVREAGLNALRKDFKSKSVAKADFTEAVKRVKPSVTPDLVKFYTKLSERIKAPLAEKAKERMDYVG